MSLMYDTATMLLVAEKLMLGEPVAVGSTIRVVARDVTVTQAHLDAAVALVAKREPQKEKTEFPPIES
jgi:acyl-CoA hydrolase